MNSILGLISTVILFGAPTPKTAAAETPAQKAKAALEQTTPVVFEKKTLEEVSEFIKAKTRVTVVIDQVVTNMLVNSSINPNGDPVPTTFTASSPDGTLREGIDSALMPHGLKVGSVGGVIMISTEDQLIVKQMRQKVSLSTGTAGDILMKLKAKTGTNIVIDPRIKKAIDSANCDLDLSDVTLETAVRLAAEVSGYRTLRMGNVLFVTSNDRAKELRPDSDGPTSPSNTSPLNQFGGLGIENILPGIAPVPQAVPAAPVPPANNP